MKIIKGPKNTIQYELTKAEHQFIRDHWREMTDRQLLAAFNEQFGCEMTFGYLRQYKRANDLIGQVQEPWTDEQVQFLRENMNGMGDLEIGQRLGFTGTKRQVAKRVWRKRLYLGLKREEKSLKKIMSRNGKKGRKELWERFKKEGRKPNSRYRDEGERWQTKDGVWMIKHQGKVKFLARHLWEQAHGKIPKGFMVGHYNGDRTDTRLDNLCLLTSEINARRNAARYIAKEPCDNWIAGIMSHGDPELREKIKERPELIELQRQRILLNRKIKKIEENGK